MYKSIITPLANNGRQRGITMIEFILYLILALAVVIGGIVTYQSGLLSSRVNDVTRGLVSISSETRGLHQNASTYGSAVVLNAALINAGVIPSTFLGATAPSIRHPFNGDMTVTGQDQEFTITLADVPTNACIRITSVDTRGNGVAGIGITGVSIEGTPIPDATLAAVSTACENDGDPVEVEFTYAR